MVCPNCGRSTSWKSDACPLCGYVAEPGERGAMTHDFRSASSGAFTLRAAKILFWVLCWVVSLVVIVLAGYRVYYWMQEAQFTTKYETGEEIAPALDRITFNDGRRGYALTYYGEDGDLIYIEQLNKSFIVQGGVARVEMPDSDWFTLNPDDIEYAEVTLSPVRTSEDGTQTLLPTVTFEVETPESPLTLVDPSDDIVEVFSSRYPLTISVVPGSTVIIDGRDQTDAVDRSGNLTLNVSVYPIGDNVITVLVDTPHHRQTRQDLILFRKPLQIDLELTTQVNTQTRQNTLTVSGTVDPTADIVVDTAHEEDSITVNRESGAFTFISKFSRVGKNTITFRAVKEGLDDSVISFAVNYIPGLNQYSRSAWLMDYTELNQMADAERWLGQPYECIGTVIASQTGENQIYIMNVGDDEYRKLIALENQLEIGTVVIGDKYKIYADVAGRYDYNGVKIPRLVARYAYKAQ